MKKYLSILFIVILLASLSACAGKGKKANSEKINVKDASFDVGEDAFPQDTKLEIAQLKKGISYKTGENVLKNIAVKFVIYDITATKENKTVQPNGAVKVTLPIIKGFHVKTMSVVHITHDGAMEMIDYKVDKDTKTISVTINKMGLYAIIQKKDTTDETSSDECLHAFIDATCTTPKVCDKCKLTQGNALGHDFSKGVCKRCTAKDVNYTP